MRSLIVLSNKYAWTFGNAEIDTSFAAHRTEPSGLHHRIVGEGLVPSRGDNVILVLGNAGGHKILPYDVMVISRGVRTISTD